VGRKIAIIEKITKANVKAPERAKKESTASLRFIFPPPFVK